MVDMLVPFFFFATVASIVWIVVVSIRQVLLARAQTAVQTRLLDKLPTAESLMAYSETTAGQSLLSALAANAITASSPYKGILNGVKTAILLAVFGVTLLVLPKFVPTLSPSGVALADSGIVIFGVISLALGIGFALATAATWVLSRRFGLLTVPSLPHILAASRS